MQSISCPSCGNKKITPERFFRKHTSPVNGREYKAYHCGDCDLEFWFPRELVRALYERDVFGGYESAHSGREEPTEADGWYGPDTWFREYVDLRSGRLLDVGCGNGTFLLGVRELGLDVYGIDFDRKSVEAGKRRGLANLYPVSLEEFAATDRTQEALFDAVTFFDVLEHQSNPGEFIRQVRSLLVPGGIIVGAVPNRKRMFVRLYRAGSLADYPPHHFLWWSRRAVKNFLGHHGFRNVRFHRADPRSLRYLVAGGFYKAASTAVRALLGRKEPALPPRLAAGVLNVLLFPLALVSFILLRMRPEKIFFQARLGD